MEHMIAIEEHLLLPSQGDHFARCYAVDQKYEMLLQHGEQRLRNMDAAGIDIAILSAVSDGLQGMDATHQGLGGTLESKIKVQTETAVKWNDELYQIVESHPDRYRGFAALPMTSPIEAANEFRRCVDKLGFVGALINGFDSTANGTPNYYVDSAYDAFWQECVELDLPIYIHPRMPAPDSYYDVPNCDVLRGSPWGFHESTARLFLALIMNGVFARFPKLKMILGHMGEIVPFWAWRIDHRLQMEGRADLATVQDTLQNNIFVTVSGFNSMPALRQLVDTIGTDRIIFATDYPMEDATASKAFLDKATMELGMDDATVARIQSENARDLMDITISQ